MWNISADSKIIQIEIGDKVISAYSSTRKKNCDILIELIGGIRKQLGEQNIAFPYVNISDSSDIPEDDFIIYFGAVYVHGNYKNDDIGQHLFNLACQHHLEDHSYEGVMGLFQKATAYLEGEAIKNRPMNLRKPITARHSARIPLISRLIP